MAIGEFDLIKRYFSRPAARARLGVGDDCALFTAGPGMELAISTDMLVAGTHFLAGTDPGRLGHKTLAVNLSDLAAMGAIPLYATLALSLPGVDQTWLEQFSRGFWALADEHGVELIGGDTTRGTLNLCVTVIGEVPAGAAIRRSGAKCDDDIWVSGTLGDAAAGLAHLQRRLELSADDLRIARQRLEAPTPRVALGIALRGVATAMLDVSDGLIGDLRHIAEASSLDARIEMTCLPISGILRRCAPETRLHLALAGGDDYELCFTAPRQFQERVMAAAGKCGVTVTKIGCMTPRKGASAAILVVDMAGNPCAPTVSGYDHFKGGA